MAGMLGVLRGVDGEAGDVGALAEAVSMMATGEFIATFSTPSVSLVALLCTIAVPPSSAGSHTIESNGPLSTSGSHWASVRRGSK